MPLERHPDGYFVAHFTVMSGPAEILIDGGTLDEAVQQVALAQAEAKRIEQKFSRYRDDSVVADIHRSRGQKIAVDEETANLLDFSAHCTRLSQGLFDITTGVLRRAWTFDGAEHRVDEAAIKKLQTQIGWHKVRWTRPYLYVPKGMELDFGGIGKEYATDRILGLLAYQHPEYSILVNLGGDLACNRPRRDQQAWRVGIEAVNQNVDSAHSSDAELLALRTGALATSGDTKRFIWYQGRRLSHILNPKTGWPVEGGPRTVTVAAPTCVQAGFLSTLALLQGAGAEDFLRAQSVPHWLLW